MSEFGGEPGVHKAKSALTPSEKLRLGYRKGVEDPSAPDDPAAWHGDLPGSWDNDYNSTPSSL